MAEAQESLEMIFYKRLNDCKVISIIMLNNVVNHFKNIYEYPEETKDEKVRKVEMMTALDSMITDFTKIIDFLKKNNELFLILKKYQDILYNESLKENEEK